MNVIVKNIPNSVTCLNLFSGCIASVAAFNAEFETAAVFIALAAIFDFLDGMLARLLKAYSPLGKELDSLADLISFGIAPALLVFSYLKLSTFWATGFLADYLPYTAFLIAVFSGLRLAKFNIDTRQTTSFIGLPVPANALFWIGTCFYSLQHNINPYIIIVLVIVFSGLLVSEIPMFSLKFKNLSFKDNYIRYLLIAGAVVLIVVFGVSGLAATIGLYLILSILRKGH